MNPWLRWRRFADRHSIRLLYCAMGVMGTAQMMLIYKYIQGGKIQLTKEELYEKGPVVMKLEEYLVKLLQNKYLSFKRRDPFKEDEDQDL